MLTTQVQMLKTKNKKHKKTHYPNRAFFTFRLFYTIVTVDLQKKKISQLYVSTGIN